MTGLLLSNVYFLEFWGTSIFVTKDMCFIFKTHLFLFLSRKGFALIESPKNEFDSGLLLGSVGTVQFLFWSLDIYSPEGRCLNTPQTQPSAPPAIRSKCIELPQSAWQDLVVTVSPPSPLPIGLHHMPHCDSPGRRNEPYPMWCFLPRLPLGLQWVFLFRRFYAG